MISTVIGMVSHLRNKDIDTGQNTGGLAHKGLKYFLFWSLAVVAAESSVKMERFIACLSAIPCSIFLL